MPSTPRICTKTAIRSAAWADLKTAPHKQGNNRSKDICEDLQGTDEQKPKGSLQYFCSFLPKEIPLYLCVIAIVVPKPLIVGIAAPAMGDHIKTTRCVPTVSHAHNLQRLSALGTRASTPLCRGRVFLQSCFKRRHQITPECW